MIPKGVTQCTEMFRWCFSFNQPILLPDTVIDCRYMFIQCTTFNQSLVIPKHVVKGMGMFYGCKSLNSPIFMPDSIVDCSLMFADCKAFNQDVIIPSSAVNCADMFRDCISFNKPIEIPALVEHCDRMFLRCKRFNQTMIIPENVKDCSSMFVDCKTLNKPIKVASKDTRCYLMFGGCPLMNENGDPKGMSYDKDVTPSAGTNSIVDEGTQGGRNMKKFDVRVCNCGRIHLVPWNMIENAIHDQKDFLLVCGNCGAITAIGAEYRSDGAYGLDGPCYDMYSYDISKPYSITPDTNGKNIAEIFFDRGIGIPMCSGEYATRYDALSGFIDDTYWYSPELYRDSISAQAMRALLNKRNTDRTTVDMDRLIYENNEETLKAILDRSIKGLDWAGTPYDKCSETDVFTKT